MSRSRQQLEGAHAELKKTGFLDRHTWIPIGGIKNDWYVRYVPGIRFFDELRALEQKPPEESESAHVVEEMTSKADAAPVGGFEPFGKNSDFDPVWLEFANVVRKYREFDLHFLKWPRLLTPVHLFMEKS